MQLCHFLNRVSLQTSNHLTQGLPHAIAVTTADVTDRQGALLAFSLHQEALSKVINVLADGGYTGQPFAQAIKDRLGASVEIAKRCELHRFAVIPQRWGVERSFAWLETLHQHVTLIFNQL